MLRLPTISAFVNRKQITKPINGQLNQEYDSETCLSIAYLYMQIWIIIHFRYNLGASIT